MTTPIFDTTRHNGLTDVLAERFETFYRRVTGAEWETRYGADLLRTYAAKHAK